MGCWRFPTRWPIYFAERGYPRERILPIYYGYAAEHFPFQPRTRAEGRPPVVVMHGSLDLHHLGDIAFEAIQYVTQQRPGTIFRFVGQRTAALEKFLARAQAAIPGFKFEATGFRALRRGGPTPGRRERGHRAV